MSVQMELKITIKNSLKKEQALSDKIESDLNVDLKMMDFWNNVQDTTLDIQMKLADVLSN